MSRWRAHAEVVIGAEQWRPIPTLANYEASSHGRIRSIDHVTVFVGRWGKNTRAHRGRILALKTNGRGYLRFVAGHSTDVYVHRAVALAFHGEPPTREYEAAHRNGVRSDNRPTNIEWSTHADNERQKCAHGTNARGDRNPMRRLAATDIRPIFERYIAGDSTRCIAAHYGVGASTIVLVISGRTWAHVDINQEIRNAAQQVAASNIAKARTESNDRRAMAARSRQAVP